MYSTTLRSLTRALGFNPKNPKAFRSATVKIRFIMKDYAIKVRLSEELFTEILIKAKSLNMTNSEFIRSTIINAEVSYKTNAKDYGYLIGSINKIGNNINQIAHNLNIARNEKTLGDTDFDDILNQLIIINSNIKSLL